MSARIGIDTGGTFTDVVRVDGARREAFKVPSTPADPAEAVLEGLARAGGLPKGGRLHHGSTVATNAVLTRTGARVAFVTTEGFVALLELGRGARDDLHALRPTRTAPLVEPSACLGVRERVDASGQVTKPLTEAAVRRAVQGVRRRRPEAVAVCLLHAVRAPAHEEALAMALREALPGVSVHTSAALSADGRETERAATTVLDAYVGPKLVAYVERIAKQVGARSLTVMRSDGGRMAMAEVRRAPVRTLLSGPAGGVAAAHALRTELGLARALSFDVGGTSTDVAWLGDGEAELATELVVGPHRASVPSLALETVGAGGGSRVTVDAGGALRVGPASAGADPGPACYGRGGPFTLTDAWLLLGRLPDALLGGSFALDRKAAAAAAGPLAAQAGLTVRVFVAGVVRVAAATTARALRKASVQRGHDPRGAALVAFGGAGPLLAAETAEHLELEAVVVPRDPGTFAAEGTLLAPLKADASRAVTDDQPAALRHLGRALTKDVEARLRRQGAKRVRVRLEVDARYVGQAFEVTVHFDDDLLIQFHERHAARYGFADAARVVEVVRMRARGEGHEERPSRRARAKKTTGRTRRIERASIDRKDLEPRDVLLGPARIEEDTGTTWVPRGWRARTAHANALWLERDR